MREALLILRKDVRRLRLELSAWILLMCLYTWMEAMAPARPALGLAVQLWDGVLAPAAWFLIVSAIHEEKLPGDRQNWLTKPIPRSSLLLAKLLFIALFLNLPLAASQVLALAANGLSPFDYSRMLIVRQVFFSAFLVMPAAALAAVTANFAQFAVALLAGFCAVLLAGLAAAQDFRWDGVSWILTSLVAAFVLPVSAVVLRLSYIPRRIGSARVVLAAGVLLCGALPAFRLWPPAFRFQERLSQQPPGDAAVRLSFDAVRDPALRRRLMDQPRRGFTRVLIPIEVQAIPSGAELLSDRVDIEIRVGDEVAWHSVWRSESEVLRRHDAWWQSLEIDGAALARLRDHNVRLHTRTAFTLLGPASVTRLPFPAENRFVSDVGFCSGRGNRVLCLSPFLHAARVGMVSRSCQTGVISNLGIHAPISYAPYSTSFGFGLWNTDIDAMQFKEIEACEWIIETRQPLAHFERDLDIPSIRLAAYEDK